jgi:glucuronate isomerase
MRADGVLEKYITGDATDIEKFEAWAATVPNTLRNPLYIWTHLELKRCFGISDTLLNPDSAREIYETGLQMLQTEAFSPREILKKMNVKVLCTTDDPVDDLSHHLKLIEDQNFEIKVLPAFRPDKAMVVETPEAFNSWVDQLEGAADTNIADF